MEITNQLESIVNLLIDEIKTKLDAELKATITGHITQTLAEYDFDNTVGSVASTLLNQKIADYTIDTASINARLGQTGEAAIVNLKDTIADNVEQAAKLYLQNYDIKPVVNEALKAHLTKFSFPAGSIDFTSINMGNNALSGDYVQGGIIKNFGSTGIDDKATSCQITILDTHVVMENPILTTGIQVKGSAIIEENLQIQGNASVESFDVGSKGFEQIVTRAKEITLKEIMDKGVVAPKLFFGETILIDNQALAPSIVRSNLRKIGTLEELQVNGETLLDNTLYVTKKRVGINTLEPSHALSVWDEEVELSMNKASKNRGYIGSHRPIAVTLGANGNNNISLDVDGSVTINDLRLGALPLSTASGTPNWSGRAGEIVFNDSPAIGQSIGWVCLEGHRWARFGIIQD